MTKFLAVMKREYLQRVRTKFFVVMTILGPLMLVVFTIVQGLLFSYKAGGDTRLAILNQTENLQLYSSVRNALATPADDDEDDVEPNVAQSMNANRNERMKNAGRALKGSFNVEEVKLGGRSVEEIKRELNQRIARNELDGYLVLPPEILKNSTGDIEYFGRNAADVITKEQITERVNRAIRKERLIANGVPEQQVEQVSRPVEVVSYQVNEKGEIGRKDSGTGFAMAFIISFLIYLTVLLY
ncbi:MAG TPA: ABC transporter permease, partial [Pyrinomonadaceae bacterium]|nr:ABC transporter permease [Pyrinomonadaceae bacterium]